MEESNESIDVFHLEKLALASSLLRKNEDAEWQLVWQNSAAESLWGNYDLDVDFDLRLNLLDAFTRSTPTSFTQQIEGTIQPFRFIATPYEGDLLLQFFPETFVERKSERKDNNVYEMAVEASRTGVFDIDLLSGHVNYTNQVYELCGLTHSDLGNSKDKFFAKVHPEDLEALEEAFEMHLETRWPFDIKFRFQTDHGNYIWLQSSGRAILDESKEDIPIRFVGSLVNISEQVFAQKMVEERERLIEQIIDSLPISIYVKDEKGCFRFFSRQTEKETGVDRRRAIGRTDYEIFPINLARQQVMQDQVAREENRLIVTEEKIEMPNGSLRWLMLGKGPIRVHSGDKDEVWVLGFSLDITERKSVEDMLKLAKEEAEEATKAKSEFLSVMSHEIRTPLNSVIGSAQLVLDTELTEEQYQHAEMIQRSGEHLLHLINDILDFNKLEADKMTLESRPFSLRKQVETAFNISSVNAGLKNLKMSLTVADDICQYYEGDEARIRQILLNLLGNAVKFTEKGFVSLSISKTEDEQVLFEVTDTGIGIAADNVDKLFAEFTQADASTTRKFGGTGLGLSICKKLVEAMKGQIGIASEEGVGSTFWFALPLKGVKEADVEEEFKETVPELDRTLDILVAEDNPSNQLLIKAILTKFGHKVTLVNNGLKALQSVQADSFDMVLMDMQMPEMDGLSATVKIRELDSDVCQIPIIALTANASSGDREKVLAVGMNDYLTKPIDISALKRTLSIWGTHDWMNQ